MFDRYRPIWLARLKTRSDNLVLENGGRIDPSAKQMPSLIFCSVSKEEILTVKTSTVLGALERCIEVDAKGNTVFHALMMSTNAYDDDSRALYDIPEMRAWAGQVFREVPHLFLILIGDSVHWFFACVAPIKVHSRTATDTSYEFLQPAKRDLFLQIETAVGKFLKDVTGGPQQARQHLERVKTTLVEAVGPADMPPLDAGSSRASET